MVTCRSHALSSSRRSTSPWAVPARDAAESDSGKDNAAGPAKRKVRRGQCCGKAIRRRREELTIFSADTQRTAGPSGCQPQGPHTADKEGDKIPRATPVQKDRKNKRKYRTTTSPRGSNDDGETERRVCSVRLAVCVCGHCLHSLLTWGKVRQPPPLAGLFIELVIIPWSPAAPGASFLTDDGSHWFSYPPPPDPAGTESRRRPCENRRVLFGMKPAGMRLPMFQ